LTRNIHHDLIIIGDIPPVNRDDYDRSITLLENALRRARTGDKSIVEALKRLAAINSFLSKKQQ
jgi:hypothetical protein